MLVFLASCDTLELDDTQDPNALSPEDASADFFINSIQQDFGVLIASLEIESSEAARILNMDGLQYQNAFEPTRFDSEWIDAYQQILLDIRTMEPIAAEAEQWYHIGMGQVLEAYVIMTMVDFFGDVPYSEALQGADNLNPQLDAGSAVYAAALDLLNQAVDNFNRTPLSTPPTDLFYNGNFANWRKAANSLKMRLYVVTRNVDSNAATEFNALVAEGDYIDEVSEDFQFPWGTSNTNPDTRHPQYVDDYTPGGANTYQSNWMMDYMQSSKVGNGIAVFEAADPRMKYYFYRQSAFVPQNNPNLINCVAETAPPHYISAGAVFCSLDNGYWGRDHGDEDGIPPDGQLRTAYGVYPVGGLFDDDTYNVIASNVLGAGGAGITPVMLSSWTDFMIAEMALVAGNNSAARSALLSAVSKSFTKVRAFGSRDQTADLSTAPPASLDAAYAEELGLMFDAADAGGKMDLIGAEYFVASFGNGLDPRVFYIRTGRPSILQPNLDPLPGPFFRSFFYPPNLAGRNSNVSQKSNAELEIGPFWDTGVTLLAN